MSLGGLYSIDYSKNYDINFYVFEIYTCTLNMCARSLTKGPINNGHRIF